MRLLSLVLALGMIAPSKSKARSRVDGEGGPRARPPSRANRRARDRGKIVVQPLRSPCGRHVVAVEGGAVLVDGRRVHPSEGAVELLAAPTWRPDGNALAWLERGGGETRLVVLPALGPLDEPIAWTLPRNLSRERVHWASDTRVVVGPALLQPRASASWTR